MLEVKIENLVFPKEDVELIEIHKNGHIRIHLSDTTLMKKVEYTSWRNKCGMLVDSTIKTLVIGNHHFNKKFDFRYTACKGTPGKTADNIEINLSIAR